MTYIEELREWANERVADYAKRMENSKPQYDKVGEFKSSSSKAIYRVWRINNSDTLRCECPGFIFRKSCKHTKEILASC
jgi:hypothetical protein